MKNSTPRIDRNKKTIYATKSFLIEAGQFGTTEFNKLNNALKENPGLSRLSTPLSRKPVIVSTTTVYCMSPSPSRPTPTTTARPSIAR